MISLDSVPRRQRARVDRQIPEHSLLTVTLAVAAHYPFGEPGVGPQPPLVLLEAI